MSLNLKDYIVVFENIVSDELCGRIIAEYKESVDWINTATGYGDKNRDVRRCDIINISQDYIISKNREVRQDIDDELFKCAAKAIKSYNEKFPTAKIEQDEGYSLLRYQEGEFYTQHTDSYKLHPRSVSCTFALNDDYEGGEFAFFDREVTYKLKKGSALMFPSNFMYPHEVLQVTRFVRYSIITWFI
jgi:predicted 2-oxoglutarate/Fe(II)-dependent dioxygenase YbiX